MDRIRALSQTLAFSQKPQTHNDSEETPLRTDSHIAARSHEGKFMDAEITKVREAFDSLSRNARPQIAALSAAVVPLCQGDQDPLFSATASLLNAVAALEKGIAADIPTLIDDVEVCLSKTASPAPPEADDDGI